MGVQLDCVDHCLLLWMILGVSADDVEFFRSISRFIVVFYNVLYSRVSSEANALFSRVDLLLINSSSRFPYNPSIPAKLTQKYCSPMFFSSSRIQHLKLQSPNGLQVADNEMPYLIIRFGPFCTRLDSAIRTVAAVKTPH